jgi:hypothetical protein
MAGSRASRPNGPWTLLPRVLQLAIRRLISKEHAGSGEPKPYWAKT